MLIQETKIIRWEQDSFVHHIMLSAVTRVDFVSNRVSHIVLRGSWCNTVVLNVYETSDEKSDDSNDRFYEELERDFTIFLSTI